MTALVYAMIFLPLLTGTAIYAFDRQIVNKMVFVLQGVLSIIMLLAIGPDLLQGKHIEPLIFISGNWSKVVGVGFRIDALSLIFLSMNLIAFWYIWLYIWPNRQRDHKFLFFLCVLQTALNALFTTDDLFAIFVLIELVTILGSILITYKKDALSVRAGLFYLLYNSWAMLLYLIGIICLYWFTGSMNIELVAPALSKYATEPVVAFGISAIFAGLGIKSAFFMLHLWLPQAHSAAPASISAILSGLIVKMGIFVILRIDGLIAITAVQNLLIFVGISSGILGATFAIFQSDMKRILAYHTVSQLGIIFTGIGLYGNKNLMGAWMHLFNHFTFKSLLFLAVGLIIMETGERRVKYIRGLWHWHKPLAICLGIGIVSIMGFPFSSASFSKMLIKSGDLNQVVTFGLYVINFGTLISFIKLGSTLFGKPSEALVNHKRTYNACMPAIYFIAAIVLVTLPIELWLSMNYMPSLAQYYVHKIASDSVTFALMFGIAILSYHKFVKPLVKKFPHWGHKDLSFTHAMVSSLFFFWFVLEYFGRA